jgi:hypothetical protein
MNKTRAISEETQMRLLLKKLTDHVLELREDQRKNNIVIQARFDELDGELKKLQRKVNGVAILGGDTFKKTVDLHVKLIGTASGLGKRVYDLEQERTQRKPRSGRAPGRG